MIGSKAQSYHQFCSALLTPILETTSIAFNSLLSQCSQNNYILGSDSVNCVRIVAIKSRVSTKYYILFASLQLNWNSVYFKNAELIRTSMKFKSI